MNIITKIIITVLALIAIFYGVMIATDPSKNIVITEYSFAATDTEQKIIVGTVQNTTNNRTYSDVRVNIAVLDKEDNVLGTSFVIKESLAPGESWSFKSQPVPPGSEGYRITVSSPDNLRPSWLGGCAQAFCW